MQDMPGGEEASATTVSGAPGTSTERASSTPAARSGVKDSATPRGAVQLTRPRASHCMGRRPRGRRRAARTDSAAIPARQSSAPVRSPP